MELRNIAIIAHVDHGKTTLVDALLRQSNTFGNHQKVEERVMDSNAIERERGITIFSKCTSIVWDNVRINIVDTPGHADFGGEVERILSMVDGAILLVDAAEGPLPQTKFVLGKALEAGLEPIVVINKIDRSDARPDEVLNEVFDLFVSLDANEKQLSFPVLYACGREGWAVSDLKMGTGKDLKDLFKLILAHVPQPTFDSTKPFSMLATTLEADPYVGRILTGRILTGSVKVNSPVKALDAKGNVIEQTRVSKILAFRGLARTGIDEAFAGDIVSIAGFSKATVSDTLCDLAVETPLHAKPIDPPTLTMTFSVNNSPLAGTEGTKVTSRLILDRLQKEVETNIALTLRETEDKDAFEVAGRGELQLGILIETMRREGFELAISRPKVLLKIDEDGRTLEPYEEVIVDLDEQYSGTVIEKLTKRKAELQEMKQFGAGRTRLTFFAPSRALLGYHSEFLTDTSGTGLMNRLFDGYHAYKGALEGRQNGVLVSMETGIATAYSLEKVQERGVLFVSPGDKIYEGMIVGENAKENDLNVNPIKAKHLTNFRVSGKEDATMLIPPRKIILEDALSYIEDDELVEVTPKTIRLRKRHLSMVDRKKAGKEITQA